MLGMASRGHPLTTQVVANTLWVTFRLLKKMSLVLVAETFCYGNIKNLFIKEDIIFNLLQDFLNSQIFIKNIEKLEISKCINDFNFSLWKIPSYVFFFKIRS